MSDKNKKISKEEFEELKEIQNSYFEVQRSYGQLAMLRLRMEQDIENLSKNEEDLRKRFSETQDKERKFVESTNKKYGDGVINPTTGEFTSNKT